MKLLLTLLLIPFLASAQTPYVPQLRFNTVAELKVFKGYANVNSDICAANPVVFVIGKDSMRDARMAFYWWDSTATTTPDDLNVVQVASINPGRYIKGTQVQLTYPTGKLLRLGTRKEFYGDFTTNGSGQAVIWCTTDGTSAGNAIFTKFTRRYGELTTPSGTYMYTATTSANLKSVTLTFSYAGTAVTVLGISVISAPIPAASVNGSFEFTGE